LSHVHLIVAGTLALVDASHNLISIGPQNGLAINNHM
jgi:hypothetical protein